MKNKKVIYIVIVAVLLIAIVTFLVLNIGDKKLKYEDYQKYSMSISLDLKTEEGIDPIMIDISYDTKSAKVSSNKVQKETFIIGNRLYYLSDNTFYIYETDTTYIDIYNIIKNFEVMDKLKKEGETIHYSTVLKPKDINELLASLFFNKMTNASSVANITTEEDKLSSFDLTIGDIEGYSEISINIRFKELSDDYTIDTSKIYGSSTGLNSLERYKREKTDTNIYQFVQ